MRSSNESWRGALVAGLVAAAGMIGSNALADTAAPPLVAGNASDPFMMPCAFNGGGWCLYTSQDTGLSGGPLGSGFDMLRTRMFFSKDGVTWSDMGIAAEETWYDWVPANAHHFWAPAVASWVEPTFGWTVYNLYVPDVPSSSIHRESRIGVSLGWEPFGPFYYLSTWVTPVTGYMSDPEVFPAVSGPNESRWLLWADGDFDSCGGISIAPLVNPWTIDAGKAHQLVVNNLQAALGSCTPTAAGGGGPKVNHPYMEGPSLFDTTRLTSLNLGLPGRYMLVFPAKPEGNLVPAECKLKGQPNTSNSVIAYATSNSIDGPYDYQGILMCGSSTEWTDQATLGELKTPAGSPRLAMIYHDGPGSPPNRKLHAECLTIQDNKLQTAFRSSDGLAWCMKNGPILALKSRANGKYVSADPQSGSGLFGNRDRIGPWEQFTWAPLAGGGGKSIQARSTQRYVSADQNQGNRLVADRSAVGSWEEFLVVNNGDGSISLQSKATGKYVVNEQNAGGNKDRLVADRTAIGPWEKFDVVYLYQN